METAMQINFGQLMIGSISLIVIVSLIQWILALWLKARLEKSIQHEYDRQLEDYKFSQLQRQKASLVAVFFAKWIKYRGREEVFLGKDELISYYEELNKMSLEISMWIDDEELLDEIMSLLNLRKDAPDLRLLVGKVRGLILKKNKDEFDPKNIIIWPNVDIGKRLFADSPARDTIKTEPEDN